MHRAYLCSSDRLGFIPSNTSVDLRTGEFPPRFRAFWSLKIVGKSDIWALYFNMFLELLSRNHDWG